MSSTTTNAIDEKRAARKRKRRVKLPKLYGAAEVADVLGVRVNNLKYVKDLPEPVDTVRASRIWVASDIDEFALAYDLRRQARTGEAA